MLTKPTSIIAQVEASGVPVAPTGGTIEVLSTQWQIAVLCTFSEESLSIGDVPVALCPSEA
jgi:hypothetical protein